MSEQASDYCPAPGNVWSVNRSDTTPSFLRTGDPFDIITDSNGDFFLVLLNPAVPGGKQKVPLHFSGVNLFMNAPQFAFTGSNPNRQYIINFKLAPAVSIGRSQKTLYCTTQTLFLNEEKDIQDSEQGVFGAEEDGGSLEDQIPPSP